MTEVIQLSTEQPGTTLRTLSQDELVTLSGILALDDAHEAGRPTFRPEDRLEIMEAWNTAFREFPGSVILGTLDKEELVGEVELVPDQTRPYLAMVGCNIASKYRHRGHGTAAVRAMVKYGFEERGFGAITAKIGEDNHISQEAAWKAGFFSYGGTEEGRLLFAFDRSHLSQAA